MDFKQGYFVLLQSTYRILSPFFSSSHSPAESPAPRGSLGPFRSGGSRQLCEHSYDEATVSRSIWTPNGCGGGIYAVLCRFLRARCMKVQLRLASVCLSFDVHASQRMNFKDPLQHHRDRLNDVVMSIFLWFSNDSWLYCEVLERHSVAHLAAKLTRL